MRVETSLSQFNASEPAALCAVGDPEDFGDTFDAARTDNLAPMTTRQEESTKKRSGNASQDSQDTSRTSRPRRHIDDRPHAPRLSKTPGTFSPGAPPSGGRGRASTGREKALPKAELPPEAPKPDASESAVHPGQQRLLLPRERSTMPQHGYPRVLPLLTRTAAGSMGSIR